MAAEIISHYRIIRKLGAGGMGEVFLAEDTKLDRKVAIKWLRAKAVASEQARKRLIREAKTAATLDHPNICTIHEIGEEGERAFIVMQYIEGATLADRLDSEPPDIQESVDITSQVADALNEAHSHGVVHRDIKPQNVIITPRGQVKVLDFGLAKLLQRQPADTENDTLTLLTDAGMAIGTVHYMSPEQARGERVDARSDLFALGALLYKCVTGRTAFTGNNAIDVCAQVIHVDPRPPSQVNPLVPGELERIVLKALAKNPDERYQSASEMLEDLREFRKSFAESHTPNPRSAIDTNPLSASSIARLFGRFREGSRFRAVVVIALPIAIAAAWLGLANRTFGPHQPNAAAKRWYEIGTNALREGAYYQASKALQSAVELDNKFALAHARLAEAYAELDYSTKAKDELLIAQSLVPDRARLSDTEAAYLKAISAVVTRDFETAIETYRKMVDQSSASEKSSLVLDLGRSYERSENLKAAIDTYSEATRLDSQSAGAFLRLAILYGRQQKLKDANEAFDKAEQIYQISSNSEGQTEVLYQRGILLKSVDKLPDARAKLDGALRMSRDNKNTYQQIRTLLQLSSLSFREGNTINARNYATEAIELAQKYDIRNQAINGLVDLGYALMTRGEFEEAGKSLRQALEFAQIDKAGFGEARALVGLGNLNLQLDNPGEAMRCLSQALDFYQNSGYRKQTSTCLLLLARAKRQKGEYDESVQLSEQQLKLARELGDRTYEAAAHYNLGSVLGIEQERYPEGLAHFDESYRIDNSLGDQLSSGYDLTNRARLLWQLGRYDEAREALGRAFSIANHPDASYKPILAYIYLTHAQINLSQSRFAEAEKQSRKVLDLEAEHFKEEKILARCALGLAQASSGALQAGKATCEEAVNRARDINRPFLLSRSLIALAEVLLKTGDVKGALAHALTAQKSFEQFGQQDSEWRAWLIAARASKLAGDEAALTYANNAANLLSSFQQKWGADASLIYLARPDVQAGRRLIDQIRGVTR